MSGSSRPHGPVRHINSDDLDDAEWDRLLAAPVAADLAPRIGNHVLDAQRVLWTVDSARITPHDFAIYLGRPVSMSGPGGAAVIITPELENYLEMHRQSPDLIDLPVGRSVIKRLRRALGHNWYEDGERWWMQRMDDLLTLTTADFIARHGVKPEAVTYARLNMVGPRQRPNAWWRDPATADLLLSQQPRLYVAQMLDISRSFAGTLRARLRREAGMAMDQASVTARMAASKRGVPAHPNTIAGLAEAARRPKSAEWREQLRERNRERQRPQSWVDREWTPEHEAVLGTMPDRAAAELLGRSIAAVRQRRRHLGVPSFGEAGA